MPSGFAFASASNSARFCQRDSARTATIKGTEPSVDTGMKAFSTSKGTRLNSAPAAALVELVPISTVSPSGVARATASAPISPLAPARFSTTTFWPRVSRIFSVKTRATVSVAEPGAKGTMARTGLGGHSCAAAKRGASAAAGRAARR